MEKHHRRLSLSKHAAAQTVHPTWIELAKMTAVALTGKLRNKDF